ncbi:leucine-rich repeat-containing protein 1 isoform X1 [Eurytemora carolleeae]|uniref:leucine-rich repeat-containing protein 1 isoform X1 n=1 Tax=Eurytemora carolleeae TaxID=1294199 RepID=UPI000C788200|nr:leucine-rich repeat-containing protein 1 isoform X1 [Eurytemora carolleeae]|eukprot:XP_023321706.1 leucine-rich repeat-containing protein 1-like isoform X1 [Eurytemora affinis]
MIKWREERRDSGFLAGMDFSSSNPPFSDLDDSEVRDDNMDISAVRGEVNGLKKEESEEVSDSIILREISQREILHWNYKGLTRFPTELLNHGAHIQELYLKENLVEQVPEKLYLKMPFLSNLHLSRNNISKIPKDFSKLSQLTLLDLSRNQLLEYPDCLNGIKTLKTLDLSHNRIQELPEKISELINLEYLVVISNSIKRVPESISLLKKLSGLYLSRNCIRELPNSLVECYSLRELYLDHNHLQYIPGSLVKLRELALLSLSGNLLRYLPHLPFVSSPR